MKLFLMIAATIAFATTTHAQTPTPTPPATTATQTTPANPADVATMDAIVAAVYDVISGPAGKRDWDRFRSLFIPGARLIPTGPRPTGEVGSRVKSRDSLNAKFHAGWRNSATSRTSSARTNHVTQRMTQNRFSGASIAFS